MLLSLGNDCLFRPILARCNHRPRHCAEPRAAFPPPDAEIASLYRPNRSESGHRMPGRLSIGHPHSMLDQVWNRVDKDICNNKFGSWTRYHESGCVLMATSTEAPSSLTHIEVATRTKRPTPVSSSFGIHSRERITFRSQFAADFG